jgi:hypothetical protein
MCRWHRAASARSDAVVEQRGAHAGLVAGVGGRPVRDEGGRAGVEDKVRQALAPRERVAAGAVGVGAEGVEALAHQVGVVRDGVAATLRIEGARDNVDVGGGCGVGAGDGGVGVGQPGGGGGARGEAYALAEVLLVADGLELASEELGPIGAYAVDVLMRVEQGPAPAPAEDGRLALDGEGRAQNDGEVAGVGAGGVEDAPEGAHGSD